jgi:hypothetical protein
MLLKAHLLLDFAFSQKAIERSSIVCPGRISRKSKNILSLPVHFSLVLGDLIANKNIEYGSDSAAVVVDLISNVTLFFLALLFIHIES